jgi:hypothetical protein
MSHLRSVPQAALRIRALDWKEVEPSPEDPPPHPHPHRRLLCRILLLPLDVVLLPLDVVAEDVRALFLSRHVQRHRWTRRMTTLYRPNQR